MSEDQKSETAGDARSSQRPHATLDLKAQRVDEPSQAGSDQPETEAGAAEAAHGVNDNATSAPRESGAAGFLTHLAAGLLGGLIALVVGYYALGNFRDRLPFVSETSAEQIKTTQQALESRVADIAAQGSEARAQLAERISALDTRTEGLARTDDEAVAALGARVDALEERLADVAAARDGAGDAEQLSRLNDRLSALDESVASLRASLDQVKSQTASNLQAARASALAVALTNLRGALDRGEPFAAEWEAVQELSPVEVETETLSAAAADGIPTLRRLRESFPAYANKALEAAGASGSDSIIGQIVESARSVVNVRPVGEIEGDTPGAIVARMENRLKAGDLPGVVAQSDQLSGAAAVQLLPWLEQVKRRISADEEMDALQSAILAELQR